MSGEQMLCVDTVDGSALVRLAAIVAVVYGLDEEPVSILSVGGALALATTSAKLPLAKVRTALEEDVGIPFGLIRTEVDILLVRGDAAAVYPVRSGPVPHTIASWPGVRVIVPSVEAYADSIRTRAAELAKIAALRVPFPPLVRGPRGAQ